MALHDESDMTILNNKNINALHGALKIERERSNQLETRVADCLRSVAQMQTEITELRQQMINMFNAS